MPETYSLAKICDFFPAQKIYICWSRLNIVIQKQRLIVSVVHNTQIVCCSIRLCISGWDVSPVRDFCGDVMELAYVCEWDKRQKSTHCPSIPLVCSWSCRNLVAFTTDLKNEEEDKGTKHIQNHMSWWRHHTLLQVVKLTVLPLCCRCQSHDSYHWHWTPLGCLLHQLWTLRGHFLSGVGSLRWRFCSLLSKTTVRETRVQTGRLSSLAESQILSRDWTLNHQRWNNSSCLSLSFRFSSAVSWW